MYSERFRRAVSVAIAIAGGWALSGSLAAAATPLNVTGAITGLVKDGAGIPQMGATVLLFNRYEKLIHRALTGPAGDFAFDSLLPDTYSVRVSLPSFVPAMKRNISIQPGMRSVLAINLASVLSSIELVYSAANPGTLMTDDWKWVLRSSMTTRPVLRVIPGVDITDPQQKSNGISIFSDTRGLVKVSSGESAPYGVLGSQPDLGTSFALATSMFGENQLQFSGNIGIAESSTPTAGFRTSFSRADSGGPELKLMMQQVSLPMRSGLLIGGRQGNAPALRSMSLTLIERAQVGDGITLDYGVSLDSVTFVERLNYLSPFARLSYELGEYGVIDVGYSSGAPPVDLLNARGENDMALQGDMVALSMLPRVSLRDGRTHVQRTENFEVGYQLQKGSITFNLGAYREIVSNGALTLSAPSGFYSSSDLLPELSSNSSLFNIGAYRRYGYTASATQALGETFSVTLAYGNGGVLGTSGQMLPSSDPNDLRRMIRREQRHWARGRIAGTTPFTGTQFAASYEWTDSTSLVPGHVFLTQKIYPETGLNVRLRQPLPAFSSLPGRLEASAELRNMLAQGYLPLSATDGRRLVLAQFPRAVRGGLSFIF